MATVDNFLFRSVTAVTVVSIPGHVSFIGLNQATTVDHVNILATLGNEPSFVHAQANEY